MVPSTRTRFVCCALCMATLTAGAAWGADDVAPATTAPALYQPTPAELAQLQQIVTESGKTELPVTIGKLNTLIDAHPTWADLLLVRAQALVFKGDVEAGQASYQAAVDLDPHNRTGLLGIASTSETLGDFARARAATEEQLKAAPGDGEAAILRARALAGIGEKKIAGQYLQSILSVATKEQRPGLLAMLLPIELQAEDFTNAEAGATEWITAAPSADGYAYRADARRGLKKFDEASADLAEGFKLTGGRPTYPLMYIGSQVLLDRGQIAQGLTLLVDLLALVPANVEVEKAIDRAVVARVAQMKTTSAGGNDPFLVPQIPYEANRAQIENWELEAALGKARLGPMYAKIATGVEHGHVLDSLMCDRARALYPVYEAYLGSAQACCVFTLDPPADWSGELKERATRAARDFRVAAAIAAVRYSRFVEVGMFTPMEIEGYLDWANFQEGMMTGKLDEPEQRLLKAYVTLDETNGWAAVQEYAKPRYSGQGFVDSGQLTGPQHVLLKRIVDHPERAGYVLKDARQLVEDALTEGDAPKALAIAEQMVKLLPDRAESWVAEARVLEFQGHSPKAHEARAKALDRDAFCAEALIMIAKDGEVLGKQDETLLAYNRAGRGQKAPEEGDDRLVHDAIAARDMLETHYTKADLRKVYATRGEAAYNAHEWVDAYVCARRMAESPDEKVWGTFMVLGEAAEYQGYHAEAAAAFQQAMALDAGMKGSAATNGQFAQALAGSGEFARAVNAYSDAIALDGEKPYLYRGRGDAKLALADYAGAATDFRTAAAKGDDLPDTQLKLADCLSHTDPAAAAETYKGVLKNPGEPELMHRGTQRTVMEAKMGLYRLQVAAAEKAVKTP